MKITREQYLKRRARWQLKDAIRYGKITRGSVCEIGGECEGPIQAHHDDYSKPLEVRWICRKHHMDIDRPKLVERLREAIRKEAKLRAAGRCEFVWKFAKPVRCSSSDRLKYHESGVMLCQVHHRTLTERQNIKSNETTI